MNCIFCNTEVILNSIEHIVPESLGNKRYVLQNGSICRACNNRFSKFEEKALTKTIIGMERVRLGIATKKYKPAISKTGKIEFAGDSLYRKNIINVKGMVADDVQNFNPDNNTFRLVVKSFDKSEVATSKLILKMGYEALFQSQKVVFKNNDFSDLTAYLTNVKNENWPFITTKLELSKFTSIPSFAFKYELKRIECRLLFSVIDNDTLLFKFNYGAVNIIINLINRNFKWTKQYLIDDKNSRLYPEYLNKKREVIAVD